MYVLCSRTRFNIIVYIIYNACFHKIPIEWMLPIRPSRDLKPTSRFLSPTRYCLTFAFIFGASTAVPLTMI